MKDTKYNNYKKYLPELIDSIYGNSCSELGRITFI